MKRADGLSIPLVLSIVLAWFSLTGLSCAARPHHGEAQFFVEVPAEHMSVGQEFTPRLVSREAVTGAPLVRVELLDAAGHRVWTGSVPLPPPDQPATISTVAMPHEGSYRLVATGEEGEIRHESDSVPLEAVPEPPASYGGVQAVSALGLSNGVMAYLREHAFAVSPGLDQGNAPIIVVGDPRMEGSDLAQTYTRLWKQVAAGTNLLLLNPPTPQLASDWPFGVQLVSAERCQDDLFPASLVHMHDGSIAPESALPVIRPVVAYDLSGETRIVANSFDAHLLPHISGGSGFAGCHALFSFRYGKGWVTVSSLPLLQHFSDTWARVYLMNMIKAAARKVKGYPAGGLADAQARRMQQVSAQAKQPLLATAAWYPAPQSIPPTAWPAPRVIDGSDGSCFTTPTAEQRTGQELLINLGGAVALQSVRLKLGPQGSQPGSFVLEGSADGRHWTRLGDQTRVDGQGNATYPATGQAWWDLRLRVTADLDHHPWSVCEVTPVAAAAAAAPVAGGMR